jgi:hypothetical protein
MYIQQNIYGVFDHVYLTGILEVERLASQSSSWRRQYRTVPRGSTNTRFPAPEMYSPEPVSQVTF